MFVPVLPFILLRYSCYYFSFYWCNSDFHSAGALLLSSNGGGVTGCSTAAIPSAEVGFVSATDVFLLRNYCVACELSGVCASAAFLPTGGVFLVLSLPFIQLEVILLAPNGSSPAWFHRCLKEEFLVPGLSFYWMCSCRSFLLFHWCYTVLLWLVPFCFFF